jgi:hypothetical protein
MKTIAIVGAAVVALPVAGLLCAASVVCQVGARIILEPLCWLVDR